MIRLYLCMQRNELFNAILALRIEEESAISLLLFDFNTTAR